MERGLKFSPGVLICLLAAVVPHVGTWIEIDGDLLACEELRSFPTWERGLKYLVCTTDRSLPGSRSPRGNWIEILRQDPGATAYLSFPTWERGLKCNSG